MTSSTEQERAEFEAQIKRKANYFEGQLARSGDGYKVLEINWQWIGWQAARRAPVGAVPQWDGVIKPSDFIVDTFRRGGSGWVPKPDNCVRITHRPTGFFEEETAMRSVHANKAVAWQRLSDRLESLAAEPQPPDAAAPVELPKPVGWFHRHPKECKNGEVCNYQIALADRKDGWEEFPLYTEQQVRTLLAEVSAPAAQADAKDAANQFENMFDSEKSAYRVWPDGTVQAVEDGEPYSWMSDDFIVVYAMNDEEAWRLSPASRAAPTS